MVRFEGGALRIVKLESGHAVAEALGKLETGEFTLEPGQWDIVTFSVPEQDRRIKDQQVLWLEKLKAAKEGDSNVLENSMIVYGAGLSDGNRHNHEDLPTLLFGNGGGAFKTGRRIVYRKETPISNMYLTMMDRMGVNVEHFGESTGRLDGLNLS